MGGTRDPIARPSPAPPAARPSPFATFGLPSVAGLLGLGAAWAIQRLGAGPAVASALGLALGGGLGLAAGRRPAGPGERAPWWAHWDVVGFVATVSLAGMATILAVEILIPGAGLYRSTRVALPVALAGMGYAAAAGTALARRQGLSPRETARRVVSVWSDPPADWAFFVLGAVMTMPLAALISPVAWDSDSARLLQDAAIARQDGLGFIVESQQVFLPMLVFPPLVAVGGVSATTVVPVITMQALAGVVAYVTRKLTGALLAPVAAVLALLSLRPLIGQADLLPLYPLMLTLGYLGGWLGFRAIRSDGRAGLGFAALAGFLLVAAAEAHDIGRLFVGVPLFLLAVEPTRRGLKTVALIYGAIALFAMPRALVNLADGGLERFTSSRNDWMVASGYTRMINTLYWKYPTTDKVAFFVQLVRPYWAADLGPFWGGRGAWLTVIPAGLAAVGALGARWRGRVFVLLCGGLMVAGLFVTKAPPHPRYLSPILPGLAILAGVGVWFLGTRWGNRLIAAGLVVGLLVAASLSYIRVVHGAHAQQRLLQKQKLEAITEQIDDDRAVAGVRAVKLISADPSLRLLSNKFFTEQEWVTYLTWPSDEQVLRVMRDHDVGWVVVLTDTGLEVERHATWIVPVYGKPVRHPEMLARSPSFCLVGETKGHILYRVGGCP